MLKTLRQVTPYNRPAALAFAKMITHKEKGNVDKITHWLVEKDWIKECTEFLMDVLTDEPSEAKLQTQLFLINLKKDRKVAEEIFDSGRFTQYDKEKVAQRCEQIGLFHMAYHNYSSREDQKRVMLKTTLIPEDDVIQFVSKCNEKETLEIMQELLSATRKNELVVAKIADDQIDKIQLRPAVELLERYQCESGLHYLLSRQYLTTEEKDIHFRLIELCTQLEHHDDLKKVFQESNCYDPI